MEHRFVFFVVIDIRWKRTPHTKPKKNNTRTSLLSFTQWCLPQYSNRSVRRSLEHQLRDRISDFSHSFRLYLLRANLCVCILFEHSFFCFIRIWLVRLAARVFGVRQCVPYIENIFIIFSLSFSRFRFTWFSYTFNFLFRRFFVVKHITFNRSIVLGCWLCAEWAKCFCAAYTLCLCRRVRQVSKIDFDIAFCPHRSRSHIDEFDQTEFCVRAIFDTFWLDWRTPYTFLLRARQSILSMVFYWIRSSQCNRDGIKKNKNVSQMRFQEFMYVYRFGKITHFLANDVRCCTNVWVK